MPARGYRYQECYQQIDEKTGEVIKETKTLQSQLRRNAKYDQNFDKIMLRVPGGTRDQLKDWVADSEEYTSVNELICKLLEKETGIDFTNRK